MGSCSLYDIKRELAGPYVRLIKKGAQFSTCYMPVKDWAFSGEHLVCAIVCECLHSVLWSLINQRGGG